ncbi:MAG: acyl-CoA desaturase [Gammaproteobacteria bacterium]|nr:MAG: acyl-CoA desaturase [Gammaproteobacteria bacterium]
MNGLLDFSIGQSLLLALLFTHITIAAVTIFLHRCQAHRALDLHPAVSLFFRTWLWLTTGMITKCWVAVHRKHHAFSDREGDPHSPQVFGLKKVLLEGAELYREGSKDPEILEKYGRGTPDDWFERHIFKRDRVGVGIMLIMDILLMGPIGITIWAIQMLWIPFFAAGVINGLGHYWGYRNYASEDDSTNILPWGILIGGEELHNNHHTFGSAAKLSSKWWEFDIGWFYIRTLSLLGLAKVRKLPPKPALQSDKTQFDMDSLKAVFVNRFYVMSSFRKMVMAHVHRDVLKRAESRQDRSLLKRCRKFFLGEKAVEHGQEVPSWLNQLFERYTELKLVYQFRQRLHALCSSHNMNQENLLQEFKQWCLQAEQTGVRALKDFSLRLRQYSMAVD